MNIIIVGCSKVGQTLAMQLNEEDNNITVIDVSQEKVQSITSRCDIMGVVGNGAIHTVQQEAGIDNADLLIAVTGSDELNLLCCLIAKKAGKCKTIARIQNPDYNSEAPYLRDELGLAMVVNPDYAAAQEIARVLRFPSAIKIETFEKGRVELLKFRLPENSPIINMSVRDVVSKLHCDILFCTVERGEDVYIVKGDFVFEPKDIISIIASPQKATDFFKKINYKTQSAKNVMMAGGGEISQYLCRILQNSGISIKIIEKKLSVCEELAEELNDVIVINGDATDKEILLEAGLEDTDAFVALTNIDEENILLSLYAKSVNHNKVITKIQRIDFGNVIHQLDLDTTICPKHITSEMIVRYVRAMKNTLGSNVETMYNIIQGRVEASEFLVNDKSPVINIPLMELGKQLKNNVLVAAILRRGTVIIPRGHDVILPNDKVVIVSETMAMSDISDVLK